MRSELKAMELAVGKVATRALRRYGNVFLVEHCLFVQHCFGAGLGVTHGTTCAFWEQVARLGGVILDTDLHGHLVIWPSQRLGILVALGFVPEEARVDDRLASAFLGRRLLCGQMRAHLPIVFCRDVPIDLDQSNGMEAGYGSRRP